MKRREILKFGMMAAGGALISNQSLAQSVCGLTPAQTEGPFYPIIDQADTDRDLTSVNGNSQLAEGKIIIIRGEILNQNCEPVSGALVEIWQACHSGKYNHPADTNPAKLDPHFQYWGKAVTNAYGMYRFKTIVPGAYPADTNWIRPPHIHFKIQKLGYMELITQMYFQGETLNEQDLILKRIPKSERAKVVIPLITPEDQTIPVAHFNISLERI